MIQCPAVQDHIEFIIKCMKKNQWMDEHFWFLAVNLQKLLAVGMYSVHRELPEKDHTERKKHQTFTVPISILSHHHFPCYFYGSVFNS